MLLLSIFYRSSGLAFRELGIIYNIKNVSSDDIWARLEVSLKRFCMTL